MNELFQKIKKDHLESIYLILICSVEEFVDDCWQVELLELYFSF